jgi:integrase/recombinase XerD
MKDESAYTLVHTNAICEIAGVLRPGIPLLVRRDGAGVIEAASDWLRFLATHRSHAETSLQTYAEVLRLFWNHLDEAGRAWDEIDDSFLIAWRDTQMVGGVDRKTINYRITMLYRFYLWAQDDGAVRNLIGAPEWGDEGLKRVYPVSVTIERATGSDGQSRVRYGSNVLLKNVSKRSGRMTHTPTEDEMYRVHLELARGGEVVAQRNTLMASWAEEAGLRRKEIAALLVEQIPDHEQIEAMLAEPGLHILELVVTKGGKPRKVPVTPDLLRRTRDFIEYERQALIDEVRKRAPRYRPPRTIFLSTRTGKAMSERAVTNLFTEAFRAAGVPAWQHRIRAKFLSFITQRYFEVEYDRHGNEFSRETILLRVAEIAGHADPETLRPYLDLVVKRHFEADRAQQHMTTELRDLSRVRRLESGLAQAFRPERIREVLGDDVDVAGVMALLAEARNGTDR